MDHAFTRAARFGVSVALVVVALLGCVPSGLPPASEALLKKASAELRCPERELSIVHSDGHLDFVEGCNDHALYFGICGADAPGATLTSSGYCRFFRLFLASRALSPGVPSALDGAPVATPVAPPSAARDAGP